MILAFSFCSIGLFLLMWSADLLVDNASIVAKKLNISTFLIGIIIIGFGTSAPEIFVSIIAAIQNKGNLALGNAIGSNITNIGLVLGCAALLHSIPVTEKTAKKDIPIVIAAGILASLLILDGSLSHTDGIVLLILLFIYLFWTSKTTRKPTETGESCEKNTQESAPKKSLYLASALTLISIILLIIASRLLIAGSSTIAAKFGISDLIIGLTIVAIGTSLPELAAAISAARKGMQRMVIGNIIGSNIFNTLGVIGITGTIRNTNIDFSALTRDLPVMLMFSFLMLIFALSKKSYSRIEGGVILILYAIYILFLIAYSAH